MGKKSDLPLHSSELVEGEKAGSGGIVWIFILLLFIWKAVQKKIQQNVALKSKNQILSIKKIHINN